jgi:hypothetical protein
MEKASSTTTTKGSPSLPGKLIPLGKVLAAAAIRNSAAGKVPVYTIVFSLHNGSFTMCTSVP